MHSPAPAREAGPCASDAGPRGNRSGTPSTSLHASRSTSAGSSLTTACEKFDSSSPLDGSGVRALLVHLRLDDLGYQRFEPQPWASK